MSKIKVNRALAKAKIGRYRDSASAMLEHVPDTLKASLTSTQLVDMLDALWRCANRSKAIAAVDICREGAIYDVARGALREIAL